MLNDHISRKRDGPHGGGGDVYLRVRTGFVAQNSSLTRWCLENGVNRRYAELVLRAQLTGEKARALRARILDAAGVEE